MWPWDAEDESGDNIRISTRKNKKFKSEIKRPKEEVCNY